MRKGEDARIVNVASMAGYLTQIKSKILRDQFNDPHLTKDKLRALVDQFQADVEAGGTSNPKHHIEQGWGNSNYGMSKLALIAMTKVWAREEKESMIAVNCCCPGYCDTDMTSHKGPRPPEEGAKMRSSLLSWWTRRVESSSQILMFLLGCCFCDYFDDMLLLILAVPAS